MVDTPPSATAQEQSQITKNSPRPCRTAWRLHTFHPRPNQSKTSKCHGAQPHHCTSSRPGAAASRVTCSGHAGPRASRAWSHSSGLRAAAGWIIQDTHAAHRMHSPVEFEVDLCSNERIGENGQSQAGA